MQNLFQKLVELLSSDDRLVSEGKLMKNKVVELALNLDPLLLKHLLKSETLKKHFFGEVEGVLIFDKIKFHHGWINWHRKNTPSMCYCKNFAEKWIVCSIHHK